MGLTVQAAGITLFYERAGVVSGGFTGIAMLVETATNGALQNWILIILLNLPLLILSYFNLGPRFAISALFSIVMFSVLIALMKSTPLSGFELLNESDPVTRRLVYTLFGGIFMGGGGAVVIRNGASTGGTEIISVMLNRKLSFPIGSLSMAMNAAIIIAQWKLSGATAAALSVITLFFYTLTFNSVQQGLNRTKTIFIISEHWDEIAPKVLSEVHRGVTLIPCTGAYTQRDKTMVYILARTVELARVRKIVRLNDPKAIVSIMDTREVLGNGFADINQ